jgi:predicted cation transporter
VPIFFELTILCSAFATVIALMVMSQLPRWNHPMFNWERFSRVGDNGFFLAIEARDPKFAEEKTRTLLESIGGAHVTLIHDF